MTKKNYVYIVTNAKHCSLHRVTNNLQQRIIEHYTKRESGSAFTSKYNCFYLLFYESFDYINNAIARGKETKE